MELKLQGIDKLPNDLADFPFWISKTLFGVKVELKNEPPEVWAEALSWTPEFLDIDESRFYETVKENTDGHYEISFELKDSQAKLNGEVIPMPL